MDNIENQDAPNLLEGAERETTNKPEGIPDKFWDDKSQSVRVDALVKSYLALEKKLSQSVPTPQDDETRARFLKAAGVPETPDEYQVSIKDDLFEPDLDLHKRLHAKGFTPDRVQEVYDLAVEKMIPMIIDMASEFQADREVERLIAKFGGEDQWRQISRQMLMFGQKNLPPQVLEGLSSSYEGIVALYDMMQSKEPQTLDADMMQRAGGATDLESMMRDPKYWRDKDPAFIAKVTQGFKDMYGE